MNWIKIIGIKIQWRQYKLKGNTNGKEYILKLNILMRNETEKEKQHIGSKK